MGPSLDDGIYKIYRLLVPAARISLFAFLSLTVSLLFMTPCTVFHARMITVFDPIHLRRRCSRRDT